MARRGVTLAARWQQKTMLWLFSVISAPSVMSLFGCGSRAALQHCRRWSELDI